jgi:hypothetical protein
VNRCAKCVTPTPGLSLCNDCATALRVELSDVPELLVQLDITRCKQDQLTGPYRHGSRSAEVGLPFKGHVAEVVWVLHNTLAGWVVTFTPAAITPADALTQPTAALARALVGAMDRIQRSDHARQATDELTHAVRYARAAIDRPHDRRLLLGPCCTGPCMTTVYGYPGNTTATCPTCGAQHDIAYRQQWLRDQAHHHLGTAPEIAGFLRIIGVQCTADQIRSYSRRKRLIPAGHRPPASPLYRIDDVIATLQNRYRHRT